jgi:hypothetical protein
MNAQATTLAEVLREKNKKVRDRLLREMQGAGVSTVEVQDRTFSVQERTKQPPFNAKNLARYYDLYSQLADKEDDEFSMDDFLEFVKTQRKEEAVPAVPTLSTKKRKIVEDSK